MSSFARPDAAPALLIAVLACSRTEPGDYGVGAESPSVESPTPSSALLASRLGPPVMDLSATRLAERVDGAELRLRSLGCKRLRVWSIAAPPGELEILSFATKAGSATRLADEAANQRSSTSPGDEGYVGANVVLFRHGTALVRLIADRPESPESLLAVARWVESALTRGEVSP